MSRFHHIARRTLYTLVGVHKGCVPYRPIHQPRWLTVAVLMIACGLLLPMVGSAQVGPFSPDAIDLPVIGRVHGEMPRPAGDYEYFGERAYGIGDVNHDGLNDWIVRRKRPDMSTTLGYNELLIFHGVQDSLPNSFHGSEFCMAGTRGNIKKVITIAGATFVYSCQGGKCPSFVRGR